MKNDQTPSTEWKEHVAADEAERFAGCARRFAVIQACKSKKCGTGRALQRKQLTAARGTLTVQGDSALGNGPAVSQDFAMINQEALACPRSDEFVDFVATPGQPLGQNLNLNAL